MNTSAIDATPEFLCREEPPVHNGTLVGFWIYLMSDCFIFASLFAAASCRRSSPWWARMACT